LSPPSAAYKPLAVASCGLGDHDQHNGDIDALYNAVKTSGRFDRAEFASAARQAAGHIS